MLLIFIFTILKSALLFIKNYLFRSLITKGLEKEKKPEKTVYFVRKLMKKETTIIGTLSNSTL